MSEVIDHTPEIMSMAEIAAERALTECGMRAEEYAKNLCPVDTGLLRNSITYALDGKPAATSTYRANKGNESGSYSGQAPKEGGENKRSVYIGTNVKYAIYVETGTGGDKKKGPRAFIRPAVADHMDEYRAIIEKHLNMIG